ncbi:TPA: superantigen-like protein SSL1 [Staphylococcus aureus]|uniref:superantigen-like protein SSL1 n=1 Tax=Staphylococcus aureus TaxID=1280 RepID=UPI00091BA279|nr:superantigen-like protein SSL1 [Staphylococcus aureus]MDI1651328.1 superantigen-like protein SSL1 [Staphylococcus aureus]WQJ27638.1 superantigen-like protein SSL1 [Staphylococcus aureus]WQJ30308.1 superantigen-like protein SSL1 [Staphylococcus aureus]WQJ37589.1 superantigen-like protein SSL1 [Staphylococcus aureus]WQJ61256.1 superantigen-like protein SSL1 [Staphylococcus aureus]
MKFKAIAKASLALGMLATGVITSNTQSVQAKTEVKQQSEADLKLYYNGPSFEYKKVTGYGFIEGKDRFIDFIYNGQYNKISLVGSDKDKYNEEVNPDIDVFVVREGNGRQADNHSIGGVTKTNRQSYFDQINTPILEIKQGSEDLYKGYHLIFKEDISLKELDYRLRERAIKQHGLYSNGLKQGRITITMRDGKSHTIDLSQKLEKERMGDSIDGRQIQKILVEIK